jgi:hypothetical protein
MAPLMDQELIENSLYVCKTYVLPFTLRGPGLYQI